MGYMSKAIMREHAYEAAAIPRRTRLWLGERNDCAKDELWFTSRDALPLLPGLASA